MSSLDVPTKMSLRLDEKYMSDADQPRSTFSHADLAKLSGLDRARVDEFAATWSSLAIHERLRITRTLSDMAFDNVELDFNDLFVRFLSDPSAEIRAVALEGLWEDDRSSTADAMIKLVREDADEGVRASGLDRIGRFANRIALGEVNRFLSQRIRQVIRDYLGPSTSNFLRGRAIAAAGYLPEPEFQGAIRDAYAAEDMGLRASAIEAMGRGCDEMWFENIAREFGSEHPELRFESARAAGETEDERFLPALVESLADEDSEVRLAAIEALGAIGGPRARQALHQVKQNGDVAMQEAADLALDELEVINDPLGVRVQDMSKN